MHAVEMILWFITFTAAVNKMMSSTISAYMPKSVILLRRKWKRLGTIPFCGGYVNQVGKFLQVMRYYVIFPSMLLMLMWEREENPIWSGIPKSCSTFDWLTDWYQLNLKCMWWHYDDDDWNVAPRLHIAFYLGNVYHSSRDDSWMMASQPVYQVSSF